MVAPSRGAERARALRRLNTPRPAEVRAGADGVPTALLRNRDWRSVAELLDRYRTEDRWWTPAPVSRTYYELLLEDGRVVTVYRDHVGKQWYEQRYG